MSIFTKEELEQLRQADAEIEESYRITNEEIRASLDLDRASLFDRKDNRQKKIAAQRAAYREANREKIAAQQAAYREANREKYNAYHRAYQRKMREAKKNAASR